MTLNIVNSTLFTRIIASGEVSYWWVVAVVTSSGRWIQKLIPNNNLTHTKNIQPLIVIFNPLSVTFWGLFISPRDVLWSCAFEPEKSKGEESQSPDKASGKNINVKRNYTTENERRPTALTARKKVTKTGSKTASTRQRSDGSCRPNRYVRKGRDLKDKGLKAKRWQCCIPGIVTQLHWNANTY